MPPPPFFDGCLRRPMASGIICRRSAGGLFARRLHTSYCLLQSSCRALGRWAFLFLQRSWRLPFAILIPRPQIKR
jgi:hypothetical protein